MCACCGIAKTAGRTAAKRAMFEKAIATVFCFVMLVGFWGLEVYSFKWVVIVVLIGSILCCWSRSTEANQGCKESDGQRWTE